MKQPLNIMQPDPLAQRAGDAVVDALRPALRSEVAGGVVVRGVVLVAGQDVTIVHGLGHEPQAWWPVDATGDEARAYRVARDKRTLTLHAVTSCTADFYVV